MLRPKFLPFLCLLSLLLAGTVGFGQEALRADILIRGGRVLDGSGNPWVRADVAVADGRIIAVGVLGGMKASRVIDAEGLYVAPGFIDTHSHAGEGLTRQSTADARALLAQGITTILANPDGGGPIDLAAQREEMLRQGLAVNVAQMIGHGSIRREVLGMEDRAPTEEELQRMKELVRAGMEAGAVALSSGPFYTPGSYSDTAELVALAKVAGENGGAYQSHIRDESDYSIGVIASVDEVITVAREAGVPGVVTHMKALGPGVWGYSEAMIRRIERARSEGIEVWADQYPYVASSTGLSSALVPRWAQAGGQYRERMADLETRARIREEMIANLARRGGPDRIIIRGENKSLATIAAERGEHPVDAAIALLAEGSSGIISFNMDDRDVENIMRQPWTMTSSDGSLPVFGEGQPHPRAYGSFPRKLGLYTRDRGVVDLATAIRSMTSLPAAVYRLPDRGTIREGAAADIVVFDHARIHDPATFESPHQLAQGVVFLLVNGELAIDNESFTGKRAGQIITRAPYHAGE